MVEETLLVGKIIYTKKWTLRKMFLTLSSEAIREIVADMAHDDPVRALAMQVLCERG